MASSSAHSSTSISIYSHGTIRQLNDAVYELYTPSTGSIDLEIIFFHGFQSEDCQNAYVQTWMRAGQSTCWLNSWLSEKFPQSRILSISYDSNTAVTDSTGKMDMYSVGENLATSIIELAEVGQTCPVVLVGHCVGGLVLKEVCLRAEQLGTKMKAQGHGMNSYDTFLSHMKGSFFYSTCQLGSLEQGASKIGGPLMKYYERWNEDAARLNQDFSELRKRMQYGWKTWGVIGANETEHSKIPIQNFINRFYDRKPQRSLVAEEGATRNDMDQFCVLYGEDHASVCKPKDQNSSSFQFFVKFLQYIYENEELAREWITSLEFPQVYISMPCRVQEVITLLQLDKLEPSNLYLVGMGGVGKSTLAKEVMVKIGSQFDVLCFVKDVKNRLKEDNLHSLIAANLYQARGWKVGVPRDDEPTLWQFLRGKKLLLVMDNVDSEELIGTVLRRDWTGRGSRLIITSRERPRKPVQSSVVHEVPFLSRGKSRSFFLAHLDVETGREIPENLIDDVVATCDGLPLTLEVVAIYLYYERDEDIWSETLGSLQKAESIDGNADDRLWAKLRVSFDRLAPREKEMFLDLAMFDRREPNGFQYDLNIWRAVWNEGVKIGLENLQNKFFIRITPKSTKLPSSGDSMFVSMHEQLRDMGKNICRTSHERIELFGRAREIKDVDVLLAKNKRVSRHTQTLSGQFASSVFSREPYPWHSIGQFQTLRLLRMSNIGLIGDGFQRFPSDISLLHMNTCWKEKVEEYSGLMEGEYWPIRAEDVRGLHRMRVLILEKCLDVRLPFNFHKLSELRVLVINGEQFNEFPVSFGLLPSLEVLFLEGVSVTRIPISFSRLSSLKRFTLKDCPALEYFPNLQVPRPEFSSSHPSMLTHLLLEDLPILENLPEALGLLRWLISLGIKGCSSLSSLPENFGQLGALERLQIDNCSSFSSLPDKFGELATLTWLQMVGCCSLSLLPENFGQLGVLKRLRMDGCSSLCSLPQNFGQLGALEMLHIDGCSSLSSLPENFGQLGILMQLHMVGCSSLSLLPQNFGQLGALERLRMDGCSSLSSLPNNFDQLGALTWLEMDRCSSLFSLPKNFGQLGTLTWLRMFFTLFAPREFWPVGCPGEVTDERVFFTLFAPKEFWPVGCPGEVADEQVFFTLLAL